MHGLVWGIVVNRDAAFFSLRRTAVGKVGTGSRPSPALRSLEQRQMAMAKPLSRPKPPEAGAEGQPLQGFGHRLASPAEIGGRADALSPTASFILRCASIDTRGDPFLRCSHAGQPRRGHAESLAAAAAFIVLDTSAAPKARPSAAGSDLPAFAAGKLLRSGGVRLSAVPDPIRGVPLSAQADGLHARIRGSCRNSRPSCPISPSARARDRGGGTNLDDGVFQP